MEKKSLTLGSGDILTYVESRIKAKLSSRSDDLLAWYKETTPHFNWEWHYLVRIRQALNRVTAGDVKRLMLLLPPRVGKSESTTIRYPIFRLEKDPKLRIAVGCYSQDYAKKFGRKCRALARSRKIALSSESRSVRVWETEAGGLFQCFGVGNVPMGEGFNLICVTGDTKILTEVGEIPIREIVDKQLNVGIVACDTDSMRLRIQKIEAHERSAGRPCVVVKTKSGSMIHATDDHPFYVVGRGYVDAKDLKPGDRLAKAKCKMPDMRNRVLSTASPSCAGRQGDFLQSNVLGVGRTGKEESVLSRKGQVGLQEPGVQERVFCLPKPGREDIQTQLLLESMPIQDESRPKSPPLVGDDDTMLAVRERISHRPMQSKQSATILFKRMCEFGSPGTHQRNQKPKISGWSLPRSISSGLQGNSSKNPQARRSLLLCLRKEKAVQTNSVPCSSHRSEQAKQFNHEPDNDLQFLPQESSWAWRDEMEIDLVEAVEPRETPEFVYNVRVSGDHNYFANGILTHNCIDDPIRDRQEAYSPALRDKVWEWYTDGVYNRREPNAAIIIIMHRWHNDDLVGRILQSPDGPNWEVIRFPMLAEENDELGRKPGEPLCPERYDIVDILKTKRIMTAFDFSARYQQRAIPIEGAHFHKEWFKSFTIDIDRYIFPDGMIWCRPDLTLGVYVDPALGKKGGDCTGILVVAFTPDGRIAILESVSRRIPIAKLPSEIARVCNQWGAEVVNIEANGFQVEVVREVRRLYPWMACRELLPGQRDKLARANRSIVLAEQGSIYLNEDGDWQEEFLMDLVSFTGDGNEKDEQVDCLAYAGLDSDKFSDTGTSQPTSWGAVTAPVRIIRPLPGVTTSLTRYRGIR